ncbi:phosphate ABC transporter substrate-binding protein PstS [Pandoraea sp.]|uniref:phosphate ABC transporter substrate-binding protein PstS n=1 Tax=Pandoraea sp. TaxID=1883445 RepID=UPI00121B78BE|nr:phosphate ABC transporter substrate-binding protein PstS [Pandoraea sp.]TAL52308.1 MAG: phosphate ABC transporter substrate-binding protein PstS [Pandoraea sp.]TAM16118.1 MAG: phosphate ABC transporter substrate-binding protein PstS [Pandoraea sp.]
MSVRHRRNHLKHIFAIASFAVVGVLPIAANAAPQTNLLETGSTLLYPLFNLWVPAFAKANPDVKITTQGTGSGTGIAEAISGVAQIGASDAYMSDAQIKQNPSILNIPLAISAQTINYNIPNLNKKPLKLDGPVLAGIYDGSIKTWNDPRIKALNPGVALPDHAIVPIHRTDGSGDTFIFSQYLSFSTPTWNKSVGYGTTISWPAVQGGVGANGNPGMVQASQQTPYSIAYIGVSFHNEIQKAGLGTALLKNRAGNFVLPTPKTVNAAASQLTAKTPADERISLVFAPGANSYPIINYEYAIVNAKQANPETAKAVRDLLNWAVSPTGGSAASFLDQVRFVALPAKIVELSKAQIAKIQ